MFIFVNNNLYSQILFGDQDHISALDLYVIDDIIFSSEDANENFKIQLAIYQLEKNNLQYLKIDGQPEALVFRHREEVLHFGLIADRNEYFLLCSRKNKKNPCGCIDNFYLYIPEEDLLQKIKPWYAWPSLAKIKLVETINQLTSDSLEADGYTNYCDLIAYLRK